MAGLTRATELLRRRPSPLPLEREKNCFTFFPCLLCAFFQNTTIITTPVYCAGVVPLPASCFFMAGEECVKERIKVRKSKNFLTSSLFFLSLSLIILTSPTPSLSASSPRASLSLSPYFFISSLVLDYTRVESKGKGRKKEVIPPSPSHHFFRLDYFYFPS